MKRKWIGLGAVILAGLGGWTYEHSHGEESSRIDSLYYVWLLQNDTVASIIYELWRSPTGGSVPPALKPASTLHTWLYHSESVVLGQVLRVDTVHIGRLYTIGVDKVYLGKDKDTLLFWEPGAPPYYVVGYTPPLEGERVFMAGRLFPYRMYTHLKEARDSLFMGYSPFPYPADYELRGFQPVIGDSLIWDAGFGIVQRFSLEEADSLFLDAREKKENFGKKGGR